MANMVMSVDGVHSVEGRSRGLASPADRQVFHTLRAAADVILAAAGTARAERYGRPATWPELRAPRRAMGRAVSPRLVVISRSARIPEDQPFLSGEGPEPLLLHPESADVSKVPAGVELRAAGREDVDLSAALAGLRADGVEQVMCEGGPNLLGQLHLADLVDELFVTISPQLVGGAALGLLGPVPEAPRRFAVHRALEDDSNLLLTYRRA
jgi:riboflavin biosynthesis pyrimidine reductase